MAVRQYGQRSIRWRLGGFQLADFSGGLNLRDSPNEIAPSESPDALNWTLDTRGAIRLRPGCTNVSTLPGTSGKPAFIFYSGALDKWLCIRESAGTVHLYRKASDLSGSWTDVAALFSATPWSPGVAGSAVASFVDWPGTTPYVIFCVPLNDPTAPGHGGMRVYDGTTLTEITNRKFSASGLALWQNRVWATGNAYPVDNLTTLYACKIGDPLTWDVASGGMSVDLRDKDGTILTGAGVAAGALVVNKKRSSYRVNDSTTGAYSTIDSASGSQDPLAVVSVQGRLFSWGADGIFGWNGVGPGVNVGDKARPLFATDPALVGGVPTLCGSQLEDRAVFAYPAAAGADNTLMLDYDPLHGWLMRYQLAGAKTISSFARKEADTYIAVQNTDVIYKMGAGTAGADDGTLITNNFRTAWLEPFGGLKFRPRLLTVEGLLPFGGTNTLTMKVYTNGDLTTSTSYDLSSGLRATAATDQRQMVELRPAGHWRSCAFEFTASGAAGDARIFSLQLDGLLTALR